MFYLIKAPWLLQQYYHECVWKIKTEEKKIYLTFDDGPSPEATPFVLEHLDKAGAKATFFCIGEQVDKHPGIYDQIITAGHRVGNHTYTHLNGWKTPNDQYFHDVEKASARIRSNIFRPPFGRITKFQIKAIGGDKLKLHTIMWHVISADFDRSISPDQCYLNVVRNAEKGSIVVFHDSDKAFPNMRESLPRTLEYYKDLGYAFESIS